MRSNLCRFFDPESETLFYFGLDLGQSRDYTAWSIVQRCSGIPPIYHVRSLKRFPLGTSYMDIVKIVKTTTKHPNIQPNILIVDNTGVGTAISDLFREEKLDFLPITITGANRVTKDGRDIRVPKRDLVSTLQILLQTKRLKIAGDLHEAQTLIDELLNFQVKISLSGHDTYGAWREGTNDDLVLATSLACWASEKRLLPKGLRNPRPSSGRKSLYSNCSSAKHLLKTNSGFFDKNRTLYITFLT